MHQDRRAGYAGKPFYGLFSQDQERAWRGTGIAQDPVRDEIGVLSADGGKRHERLKMAVKLQGFDHPNKGIQ